MASGAGRSKGSGSQRHKNWLVALHEDLHGGSADLVRAGRFTAHTDDDGTCAEDPAWECARNRGNCFAYLLMLSVVTRFARHLQPGNRDEPLRVMLSRASPFGIAVNRSHLKERRRALS